jgi:hypothetical protein
MLANGMEPDPHDIDRALAAVKRALDRLSEQAHHEEAFEIARAQFVASVRSSFPANLAAVGAAIDRALSKGDLSLTDDERAQLQSAAALLRSVRQP